MHIVLDNRSGVPIYDQICSQIQAQILQGSLETGAALPSIRSLAKDLHISVITTKRAYEELEKEGFIYAVPAKGFFVSAKNLDLVREQNLRTIENHLEEAARLAASSQITREELLEMLSLAMEEYLS